jgi:hypothetical protein
MPATVYLDAAAPMAPHSAVYTLLLLAHVACAVVGFGSVAISGVFAASVPAGPCGPRAEAVRRYFTPGVNWAGRALYGVPVFGFALLAASRGAFHGGDRFVVAGLVLWTAAAVVAEAALWPAERRIQQVVSGQWERALADAPGALARDCRVVAWCAVGLLAVFVVATVLMVGKP